MYIEYNDKKYLIIVEKKDIKNTYIRVKDNLNILITTNKYTTNNSLNKLIKDNIKSIKKMIEKKELTIDNNKNFYYFGKEYDIVFGNCFDEVSIEKNKIYVKDDKTLTNWLQKEFINICEQRLDYYYNVFSEKIPNPRLKIRKMKTRWGVCNRKDNSITLNSELLKKDIECLNYVIVHELSHFVQFDHSVLFWNIVNKYYPNYKKIRKVLKNG